MKLHTANKARDFASCKFLMELGAAKANEKVLSVQKVHAEYCRATSDLPPRQNTQKQFFQAMIQLFSGS